MAVYGDDIVQQDLGTDDMLLHFNSLAMHMSGSIVLKKVPIQGFDWNLIDMSVCVCVFFLLGT